MSRVCKSQSNLGWKGLLEVILPKHPLKAGPTSKLSPALKLDQVAWGPIPSRFVYFQGWTLQNLPTVLVQCLTIFMAGKINTVVFYHTHVAACVCWLSFYHHKPTGRSWLLLLYTLPLLKTAVKILFKPSHPKPEQIQLSLPLLIHLVLQSPLASSVPVYWCCTPFLNISSDDGILCYLLYIGKAAFRSQSPTPIIQFVALWS